MTLLPIAYLKAGIGVDGDQFQRFVEKRFSTKRWRQVDNVLLRSNAGFGASGSDCYCMGQLISAFGQQRSSAISVVLRPGVLFRFGA